MARAPRFLSATLLVWTVPFLGGCMSMPIHNVNVLGGTRMLDTGQWEPVDRQLMLGVELDTYKPRSGVGGEIGVQYSSNTGSVDIPNQGPADVTGTNLEFYLGARKTFPLFKDKLFPYLSVGLSYLSPDFEVTLPSGTGSDGSDTFGVYIRGGGYWNFAGNWHLGVDLRRLIGTELEILGVQTDADYFQVALFLGFAF